MALLAVAGVSKRFGDTVAVTATGARRLGKRPLDFAAYHVAV